MVGKGIRVIKLRARGVDNDDPGFTSASLSVPAIAKQTGIDRKTVRKYIERGLGDLLQHRHEVLLKEKVGLEPA